MNKQELKELQKNYLAEGSRYTSDARIYLSQHIPHWNAEHQREWSRLIQEATHALAQANAVTDLLMRYK